ncbi:hypothetical protein PMV_062 [Port-miou virus]|uniref:Uncharacterized protein n=1 Tax=Port-miou virus TaxID=1733873 RepID=A0A0N7G2C7_9VIRU|nr:hypothetical protein PMV_062 [Port-miou virus]
MDNLEVKNIDSETKELLEGVGKDYQTIFALEKTYGYHTFLSGTEIKHGPFKVTVKKGKRVICSKYETDTKTYDTLGETSGNYANGELSEKVVIFRGRASFAETWKFVSKEVVVY